MKLGYARISTADQNTDLQIDALGAAGCDAIFSDIGVSGAERSRPELARLLEAASEGDVLVVWKLDRLGRSLGHLIGILDELGARGVNFESLTEKIETATPYGEFIFHMVSALAHMERRLISERTREGMAAAKRRGKHMGPKFHLDEAHIRRAWQLVDDGVPIAHVARRNKVSYDTLRRGFIRHGLRG